MRLKSLAFAIAIVAISLACCNCVSGQLSDTQAQRNASPIPSDFFSRPLKEKAIAIAQNDTWVNDKINSVGEYSTDHPYGNVERRVKDAVISSYTDRSPGANNTTYRMPAVIFAVGNESLDGADVYVFVDPMRERVAAICYVHRPGLPNGRANFSDYDRGVKARFDERGGCLEFYNMTIVNTGYPYYDVSRLEAFHQEIANVTLNDPGVKSELNGHSRQVTDFGIYTCENPAGYVVMYPTVTITVTDTATGAPTSKIMASVDPKANKVINYLVYPAAGTPDVERLFPSPGSWY
jgi:hypothetical protein